MAPRLRGYRIERYLGEGSSARVWQASRRNAPPVAAKVLRHPVTVPLDEVCALRQVEHPNLVRLHEVRHWRGATVLVLDLAAGGSLAALLARRRRLSAAEVVGTVTPVASAVAAVHAAGLVHSDLSPGNVLLTAEGMPMLSDLGSVYAADGTPFATPPAGFADPVTERGGIGGAAGDVYGLAAVAFAALTGEAPAASRLAALRAADVPEPLVDVVLTGLDPAPARRGTALEFALALRWSGPMAAVDLHAGRHSARVPLPALTRGRGARPESSITAAPVTAGPITLNAERAERSPFRRPLRVLSARRDRPALPRSR